jgi:uncharacterized protein (TIGR03435 family)
MKMVGRVLGVVAVLSASLFGQMPVAAKDQHPSFEVSTIKPSAPGEENDTYWSQPKGDRFWAKNISLDFLIQMAFGVDKKLIVDDHHLLTDARFDVMAKAEDGMEMTRDQMRPRLQRLLEERFHLVCHFENREKKGFVLMAETDDKKLKPADGKTYVNFRRDVRAGKIHMSNCTMAFLASSLSGFLEVPVQDETGLQGHYDVDFDYAAGSDAEQDSDAPALSAALEKLGLNMRSAKVAVGYLMIDQVSKTPSAN